MNNVARFANIPLSVLPLEKQTYSTSDEWYVALAEMHIAQLIFQQNDSVSTENYCRNKYVARQIFRRLAKDHKLSKFGFSDEKWSAQSKTWTSELSPAPSNVDPFRIWSDDFRPGNCLVDESGKLVSVIDWEFTYAAPSQFILNSPWWPLIEVPKMWIAGIDDWYKVYDKRLKTLLSAMENAEKEELASSEKLPFLLSSYMRESWETVRFWIDYVANNTWVLDTVFWKYLDERPISQEGKDVFLNSCFPSILSRSVSQEGKNVLPNSNSVSFLS